MAGQPHEVERLRAAAELGISYRRFHGWEPRQVHRGYDREGNRVALSEAFEVVVETESEWDDDSRHQALSLRAYERSLCGCGFPKSWTRDKSRHFTFEDDKCPVCAAAEKYGRIQQDTDDKHRKSLGETPPANRNDPADGRRTFLRLMSPDEVEQHQHHQKGDRRGHTH